MESFGQLGHTLRHLRGYRNTLLFLLAYLFYNDGIQTVIAASSIFGQEELGFSSDQLVLTILVVQFVGMVGALLFGLVFQLTDSYRNAILALLVFFLVGGVLLSRVRMREGILAAGNPLPQKA